MSRPAALILAGGEGTRLGGVRKATLKFSGERLIERVGAVLSLHCTPTFVSTGPVRHRPPPLPPGAIAIPDLELPIGGPLAGVIALAGRLGTDPALPELAVTAAVDTPLLPPGFVPALIEHLPAGAPAAYVTYGENFYPTNAVWRRAALMELNARVLRGMPPKSLRAFLEDIGAAAIAWPSPNADPFANINTLADLATLTRRMRQATGAGSCRVS